MLQYQKFLGTLLEGEDVKKWAVCLMADPRDYANIVWGVDGCMSPICELAAAKEWMSFALHACLVHALMTTKEILRYCLANKLLSGVDTGLR